MLAAILLSTAVLTACQSETIDNSKSEETVAETKNPHGGGFG